MTRDAFRFAALASLAVATGAWLAVIVGIVTVVGGVSVLALVVAGSLALAWLVRDLRGDYAVFLGVAVLLVGFGVYLLVVPPGVRSSFTVSSTVSDTLALLTGYSAYRLIEAGAWALAVTPGPLFLAWYFGFRRSYAPAALVAGGTLGFFVLTGDVGVLATLAGTIGALLVVACGRIADYGGGGRRQAQLIAAGVALCVLTPALVTAVPGGTSTSLVTPPTPQTDLSAPGDHLAVGGRIRLSPKVAFVVSADAPASYRVASYDRFSGTGWVQSGAPGQTGRTHSPPGPTQTIQQTITLRQPLDVLPAAAEPISARGIAHHVTQAGNLRPDDPTTPPATYHVRSERVNATPAQLRRAGTDYPADVASTYLQVPASTDPGVAEVAANVTAGARSSYAKAQAVSKWLRANRAYNLDAPNPRGDLVNYFVLNENATGYCTYYATAMVVMLRTQGVPARFVVGYTSGQQVDADQWVVRGYDSHAWVEVYVPDYGWVAFDPTPAAPRQSAEGDALHAARVEGVSGVDTAGSASATTTTTAAPGNETAANASNATANRDARLARGLGATATAGNTTRATSTVSNASNAGSRGPVLPPPGTLALWVVLLTGLVAGLQYSGLPERAYRVVWLRRRPSGTPEAVAAEAFDRVEYVLARTHRPRRDGETVRHYLDAIRAPDGVRAVALARERARYGRGLDDAAARDALRNARRFLASHTRLPIPPWT